VSSDVEQTVRFYQDVLGFPLTELIENRDYPGVVALLLRHR
jgi:catechol 2,3-dioxygenase-like lactoylglutathione lyase family enzyme